MFFPCRMTTSKTWRRTLVLMKVSHKNWFYLIGKDCLWRAEDWWVVSFKAYCLFQLMCMVKYSIQRQFSQLNTSYWNNEKLSALCLYPSPLDNEMVQHTLSKRQLLLLTATVVWGHPARGERWCEVSEIVKGENTVVIQERRDRAFSQIH